MIPLLGGLLAVLVVAALLAREAAALGALPGGAAARRGFGLAGAVLGSAFCTVVAIHLASL